MMVLLLMLLLSYTAGAIGQNYVPDPVLSVHHHDSSPTASQDQILARAAVQRHTVAVKDLPKRDPSTWPVIAATIAMIFCLFALVRTLPQNYLSFNSHRLAGWQDSNIQFRFAHSR